MKSDNQKIWIITGISSGLGKALAEAVIAKGDYVVGTMRNPSQIEKFNRENEGKAVALPLDLSVPNEIDNFISQIGNRFPRIDVLVNNAGYGLAGAVEETSLIEARNVMEVHFFGVLHLLKGILPLMIPNKDGHIFNISSHSGFKGFAGFGIYGASKFALEGMSEALSAEVFPLGLQVTIVEPGPFRTEFAGTSLQLAEQQLPCYSETAGAFRLRLASVNGKQEGDPQKAADIIVNLALNKEAPLRLILGKIAVGTVRSKLDSVRTDLEKFESTSSAAVFESW